MKKGNSSCPVPIEQQPIYEYQTLKSSRFFFWTTESIESYINHVIKLLVINSIIIGTFLSSNNSTDFNHANNIVITSLIVDMLLILFFLRIYLGWEYVYKRLTKATVAYEESGWYDGQVWVKTPDVLMKDRVIADYILFPILKRIKITLGILTTYLIVCLISMYS